MRERSRTRTAPPLRRGSFALWHVGVVAAVFAVLAALGALNARSDPSQLAKLPEPERRVLYERTLADVTQLCKHPAPAAARHCAHQAELLAVLPECTGACQELASRWLPRPTK